ncbi:hypothetical protein B0H13DRAFT_2388023 [Mycena leptocephala]|nr:hypothetical protein B0H13DRAFT_2388023 [Mycena leptocephala]
MAAPRLTLDPALESCPEYSSASFQLIRNLIVAGAPAAAPLTNAEAASQLSDAWNTERDARQTTWDAEVQVDAAQAAADAVARAAQSDANGWPRKPPLRRACRGGKEEAEVGLFDSALKKLDAKEYVELWY